MIEASSYANNYFWNQMKRTGANFVSSMLMKNEDGDDERVRLGVILVEGPKTYLNYEKCLGALQNDHEADIWSESSTTTTTTQPPDMEKDCGVKWIHHLGQETTPQDLAAKVNKLESNLDTLPFTSGSLMSASQEFKFGRPDAKSVVVVVTDGHPVSEGETHKAAQALIDDGVRLTWMVTFFAGFGETESWTSKPVEENFVKVTDGNIPSPQKMNELISKFCPVVVGGPTNTGPP